MQADDVAELVVARQPRIPAMKLQKLIYYAHAWHLAITDEPLVTDYRFKAWAMGPVLPTVWHARKSEGSRARSTWVPDSSELIDEILDLVNEQYGSLSGNELSALTHAETPWVHARGETPEGDASEAPLDDSEIARFYREQRELQGYSATEWAAGGLGEAELLVDEDATLEDTLNAVASMPVDAGCEVSFSRASDLKGVDYSGIGPERHAVRADTSAP